MKKLLLIVIGIGLVFCVGCQEAEVQKKSYEVISGEKLDQSRITLLSDTVQLIYSLPAGGRINKDLSLIVKSRLDPPTLDGEKLMATCIAEVKGGFAASYNYRGAPYRGAMDYVNSNLKLQSQVIFNSMDAHSLFVSDVADRKVYLAGASEAAQGASLGGISLSGNDFFLEDFEEVTLGSYAATSVFEWEGYVLATTGDDEEDGGGLYILDVSMNILTYEPIHDARWVTVKDAEVYVMQGTPGILHRYVFDKENQSLQLQATIDVAGADVPESKSSLWIQGSWMFVAGGSAGVHLIDLSTNQVVQTMAFDAEDAVVNAVAANDEYVFVSCGEAGVYVASYEATGTMETLGYLDLALNTSVNHIYQKSNKLYVAAGLEGLLSMQIK